MLMVVMLMVINEMRKALHFINAPYKIDYRTLYIILWQKL